MRGASIVWISLSMPLAIIVAAEIFVPVLFDMKITSVNEYFKLRYKSELAMKIASITTLVTLIPNLALNLYYPGLALAIVTNMSESSSVILCGLLCTAYTSFGGLKAVIWTDFVQYTLIMFSLIMICIKGTADVGSMVEVFNRADWGGRLDIFQMDIDLHSNTSFWNILFGWFGVCAAFLSFNQMQIQRTCCMPSLAKAKLVIYLGGVGFVALLWILIYVGLVIFANYTHCDPVMSGRMEKPDQLLPYYVTQHIGKDINGFPGLFVAGVFAASLSTLSSGINAIAAFFWEDFGKKYLGRYVPEDKKMIAIKLLGVGIGLLITAVALGSGSIGSAYASAIVLSGSAAGPLFVAFLLGSLVPFANAYGAISAMVSGLGLSALIVIGGMIEKRSPMDDGALPLSTEDCPWPNTTTYFHYKNFHNYTTPTYHPVGMNKLYHISNVIVPMIGMVVSLVFGIIVSLATGGDNGKPVDPRFMLPAVNRWRGIEAPQDQELQKAAVLNTVGNEFMYPVIDAMKSDRIRRPTAPDQEEDAGFEERDQF